MATLSRESKERRPVVVDPVERTVSTSTATDRVEPDALLRSHSRSLQKSQSASAEESSTTASSTTQPVTASGTSCGTSHTKSLLEEQDTAVFGNTNEDLADALAELVQGGIQSGVASLPLLQDPVKSKALEQMIQKPYMKHIDIMEVYAQRNIFTLRHSAPRRRQRIVERFPQNVTEEEQKEDSASASACKVAEADAAATAAALTMTTSSVYPNKEEIPSKEAMAQLQDELAQLATELQAATNRRKELLVQGASLAATQSLTEGAVQSLQQPQVAHDLQDIHGTVTAAVMGGQGLQELTREGKRLQSEVLDNKTNKRKKYGMNHENDEENDDPAQQQQHDGDAMLLPLVPKKRVLTMEEAYRQDREGIQTTVENLSSLSNLLKKPSTNNKKSSKNTRVVVKRTN